MSAERKRKNVKNLQQYLLIGEAARVLGVSQETLRNWEKTGKMRVFRHPINRYRLFRRKDLLAFLRRIESRERSRAVANR